MSKQKAAISDARELPAKSAPRGKSVVKGAQAPELVAFEIDDSDFGGDPYNHTGSFCVLKFDKND